MHGGFNQERKELMKRSLVKQFGKDVLKEIEMYDRKSDNVEKL